MLDMLLSDRFLVTLGVAWTITPLLFILIGVLFESRLVPLGRNQSRAFMPGDLALGVVLASGWYLFPQVSVTSVWRADPLMLAISLVAGGLLCWAMRKRFDGPAYHPRALRSPTKVYHDFVLYIFYAAALIYVCVPSILTETSWGEENLGPKLLALFMLAVWMWGVVCDALNPRIPTTQMHVRKWQPLITTSRVWWLAYRLRRMI